MTTPVVMVSVLFAAVRGIHEAILPQLVAVDGIGKTMDDVAFRHGWLSSRISS
jgi:hypothetical protein